MKHLRNISHSFLALSSRYWIREGDYIHPKSCLEIMFRGFAQDLFTSGMYKIESPTGGLVETYCDFDRHGGGWTLLIKTVGKGGWNAQNVLSRAYGTKGFSIFGLYDVLKGNDAGEVSTFCLLNQSNNVTIRCKMFFVAIIL